MHKLREGGMDLTDLTVMFYHKRSMFTTLTEFFQTIFSQFQCYMNRCNLLYTQAQDEKAIYLSIRIHMCACHPDPKARDDNIAKQEEMIMQWLFSSKHLI